MKLFVYGSLQHPLVWQRLIGKICHNQPAILYGWQAVRVKNEDYPGLVQADGQKVVGMIKHGLSKADFAVLDRFEGWQYQRTQVIVTDAHGQQQVYVYRFKKCLLAQLSNQLWQYDDFDRNRLQHFLTYYPHFKRMNAVHADYTFP